MVRVEEGLQLCVLAVQSAGVLGQIISTDGEEVALLGQLVGDEDSGVLLEPDTVVSMNFWGFMPSVFDEMERYFEDFLRRDAGENAKAECLLPNMVGKLLKEGRLSVSVLQSKDRWFGMTYHEDRARVAAELLELHREGVYPRELR